MNPTAYYAMIRLPLDNEVRQVNLQECVRALLHRLWKTVILEDQLLDVRGELLRVPKRAFQLLLEAHGQGLNAVVVDLVAFQVEQFKLNQHLRVRHRNNALACDVVPTTFQEEDRLQ